MSFQRCLVSKYPVVVRLLCLICKGGNMAYSYKQEYMKWKRWKDKEDDLLKQLNVPDKLINELREFDKSQFNSNRRFYRHQNVTKDEFFSMIPQYQKKEIETVEDILDSIENESLYEYLKEENPLLLTIILLKTQGYSVKEISKMIHLPISTIYHKITNIKKKFHES